MAMSQTLFTATIRHSSEDRRIRIECRRDGDRFRWYGPSNDAAKPHDTEVSSPASDGVHGAMNAAEAAWSSPRWQLRSSWLGNADAPGMGSREFRAYVRGYLAVTGASAKHGRAPAEVMVDRAWAESLLASHRRNGAGMPFPEAEIAEIWPTLRAAFERAGHKPSKTAAGYNVGEDGQAFPSAAERTPTTLGSNRVPARP
jgi:hypothetical protein